MIKKSPSQKKKIPSLQYKLVMKSPAGYSSPSSSLSPGPSVEEDSDVLVSMERLEAEAKDVSHIPSSVTVSHSLMSPTYLLTVQELQIDTFIQTFLSLNCWYRWKSGHNALRLVRVPKLVPLLDHPTFPTFPSRWKNNGFGW